MKKIGRKIGTICNPKRAVSPITIEIPKEKPVEVPVPAEPAPLQRPV